MLYELFTLIAATDSHGGLGKDNTLPWSSSKDMAWFKRQTTTVESPSKKNACIMGRKIWESLPETYRPLPDRLNLVLSRDSQSADFEGAECFSSLDAALDRCQSDDIDSVLSLVVPHFTKKQYSTMPVGGCCYPGFGDRIIAIAFFPIFLGICSSLCECPTFM